MDGSVYGTVRGYLDFLKKGLLEGGDMKEAAVQFWQFSTLQDWSIYSDEEIYLYEKNVRAMVEAEGSSLTADKALQIIHEQDMEKDIYPDKKTWMSKCIELASGVLKEENVKYLERNVSFDVRRLDALFEHKNLRYLFSVNVIRPERAVLFCVTFPIGLQDKIRLSKNDWTVRLTAKSGEIVYKKRLEALDADEKSDYFAGAVREIVKSVKAAVSCKKTGGGGVLIYGFRESKRNIQSHQIYRT